MPVGVTGKTNAVTILPHASFLAKQGATRTQALTGDNITTLKLTNRRPTKQSNPALLRRRM
jgi:hypothetical protein